jgi:hypothetical protein
MRLTLVALISFAAFGQVTNIPGNGGGSASLTNSGSGAQVGKTGTSVTRTLSAGTGAVVTQATDEITIASDSAVIPQFSTGAASPSANCTAGRDYYTRTTNPAFFLCTATNTWTQQGYARGNTAPATCAVGEVFFDSDATAGSNWFGCTATNTWTLLGGGGAADGPTETIYHPTADDVTANDTAFVTKHTIAANTLTTSTIVDVIAQGLTVLDASGAVTVRYDLVFTPNSDCTVGGTGKTLRAITNASISSGVTGSWRFRADIGIKTSGASGVAYFGGEHYQQTTASATSALVMEVEGEESAGSAVDTTVTNYLCVVLKSATMSGDTGSLRKLIVRVY